MMKKTFFTLLGSYGLMLIPYIASQFGEGEGWSIADLMIGGLMLFGLGMLLQFLTIKLKSSQWRIPVIIGVIVIFILIWMELALGILGTPFAGS